jgi:hypothetical protein
MHIVLFVPVLLPQSRFSTSLELNYQLFALLSLLGQGMAVYSLFVRSEFASVFTALFDNHCQTSIGFDAIVVAALLCLLVFFAFSLFRFFVRSSMQLHVQARKCRNEVCVAQRCGYAISIVPVVPRLERTQSRKVKRKTLFSWSSRNVLNTFVTFSAHHAIRNCRCNRHANEERGNRNGNLPSQRVLDDRKRIEVIGKRE